MNSQKHATAGCLQGLAGGEMVCVQGASGGDKSGNVSRQRRARHAPEFGLHPVGQQSQLWPHIEISDRSLKKYQCPGASPEQFNQKVGGGSGG